MGATRPAVAIVSGGAGGIGAAVCRRLAALGHGVVVADLDVDRAESRCEEIRAELPGARVVAAGLDVGDEASWTGTVRRARRRFGPPTMLVNCAGVIGGLHGPEQTTSDEWHRAIEVNQTGTWNGVRAVAPAMRLAGGGAIVNVGSVYGAVGYEAAFAYSCSKGAVRALTTSAAIHYARYGIRVNCVVPGVVDTELTSSLGKMYFDRSREIIPLGRLGDPAEIAGPIVFLASEDASYITGAELIVDGGYTAQ